MNIHTQKKILGLILMFFILFSIGCSSESKKTDASVDLKPVIFTTIYPIYDFTQKIGGNNVEIIPLIPFGVEPHSWEPTPKTLTALSKADMLIYHGGGIDDWVEKIADSTNSNLILVKATEDINFLYDEHELAYDPHVWLNPLLAKKMAENITYGLTQFDPEGPYLNIFQKLSKEFDNLDLLYETSLKKCSNKNLVVTHDAFNYLAKRYELNTIPLMGLSAESKPTPSHLAQVVKTINEKNIKYIFSEELLNHKLTDILAHDTGAEVLVLNPLGSISEQQMENNQDYFSLMKKNLDRLKKGLGYNDNSTNNSN